MEKKGRDAIVRGEKIEKKRGKPPSQSIVEFGLMQHEKECVLVR